MSNPDDERRKAADPVKPDHYKGDYVMRIIEDFDLDFLSGTILRPGPPQSSMVSGTEN